jgi:DHA2 family multidrug resistance protein
MATDALRVGSAPPLEVSDPYAHRYIIAITVTLAAVMEQSTRASSTSRSPMMGDLGATLDQIALVSTGYIVSNVIVLPITGWLSALFGRRRYFAGSIALFTIASFFCGNSHSLVELVGWRIVQGLGGGALLSTAQAVLYEVFPPSEYGIAMSIFGVGVMVGPTLGPTLGGWITDTFSWPWIFYINLPFGALALMLTLSYLRNSRFARRAERVDWLGLGLLALGIGTLQTMLERGERLDWFSSREIVLLTVVSVSSLVGFVWHELRDEHPVVDLHILKNPQFAAGVAFGGMLGLCLYATVFVLPVYLQTLQGFTANQTGMVILPGAIASAITMGVMGRFRAKFDGRISVVIGVAIFMLAMWQMQTFTTLSGKGDFFWPLVWRGLGLGLIFVPLTNLALAELPMEKIPNGTGLFNLKRQLGGSIGIALAATTLQHLQATHRAELASHVNAFNPAAQERLAGSRAAAGPRRRVIRERRVAGARDPRLQVRRQAMMSFEQLFLMFGWAFALGLPLLLFMRKGKGFQGGGDAELRIAALASSVVAATVLPTRLAPSS